VAIKLKLNSLPSQDQFSQFEELQFFSAAALRMKDELAKQPIQPRHTAPVAEESHKQGNGEANGVDVAALRAENKRLKRTLKERFEGVYS